MVVRIAFLPFGWLVVKADLLAYVERFPAVSASCRLPLEEEELLLDRLVDAADHARSHQLHNHASVVRAVAAHVRMRRPLREVNREVRPKERVAR